MSLLRQATRATRTRGSLDFSTYSQVRGPIGYTDSGEPVTIERAMGLPAVFAAIRLISETAGAMPLLPYRRLSEGRSRATNHPSYRLLSEQPNPEQTAVEVFSEIFAHLAGWGNAYIGKTMVGSSVTALWPIPPACVTVKRERGKAPYYVESLPNGEKRTWTKDQVIHIKLFTSNGTIGLSPIAVLREALGMQLAMQRHGGRFFKDSAVPSGVIKIKGVLKNPESRARIRDEWNAIHRQRSETAVLDDGAEYMPIAVSAKDAQFVELWGITTADIARAFRVPASLLGASTGDSLTYGNRESDAIQFLTFSLTNPLRRVEQALSNDLNLFPQRDTFFCEFLRDSILQADSATRAAVYEKALDPVKGWANRAEIRDRENLPPEAPPPAPPVATATNGHGAVRLTTSTY